MAMEEKGWGDGLPCVPPTDELVDAMLEGWDPSDEVAAIPPLGAVATVGLIAVNAVMAGCAPGALPVVTAAVRAAADPEFNLLAVQSTTNPAGEVVVVSGPVRSALGFDSGVGCMGPTARTNLTVGRAVRLSLVNIGSARAGTGDRATHGFPGKITFCFAEAEESPWPPLHKALGLRRDASAVTVVSGSGSLNLLDTSDDAEELLLAFSRALAYPSSNDYLWAGTPLLVLGPEHANVIAAGGFDRAEAQRFLFEHSAMPAGHVTRQNLDSFLLPARTPHYGEITPDTGVHISDVPEDILLVVAGGAGTHSVYIPTFGDSRAVVEEVRI
jgi:hypothetical protein